MAKQEKKALNVADKAGVIDTFWSLAERVGLTKVLAGIFSGCSAISVAIWSYLESNLPYWAVTLVFIISLSIVLAFIYITAKAIASVRAAMATNPIDNTELYKELNSIGSSLLELSIAHDADYQQARFNDIQEEVRVKRETGADYLHKQVEETKLRNKLGDIYSSRYAGRVRGLITRASVVLGEEAVDRRYWSLRHRSYNDPYSMRDLGTFLIDLSVAIEHDVPLPDRW